MKKLIVLACVLFVAYTTNAQKLFIINCTCTDVIIQVGATNGVTCSPPYDDITNTIYVPASNAADVEIDFSSGPYGYSTNGAAGIPPTLWSNGTSLTYPSQPLDILTCWVGTPCMPQNMGGTSVSCPDLLPWWPVGGDGCIVTSCQGALAEHSFYLNAVCSGNNCTACGNPNANLINVDFYQSGGDWTLFIN